MLGSFSCMLLLSSADFLKINFSKHSSWNNIRVLNGLDPDQDPHSVCPDLGPNCLQRLSADNKIHLLIMANTLSLLNDFQDYIFPLLIYNK